MGPLFVGGGELTQREKEGGLNENSFGVKFNCNEKVPSNGKKKKTEENQTSNCNEKKRVISFDEEGKKQPIGG